MGKNWTEIDLADLCKEFESIEIKYHTATVKVFVDELAKLEEQGLPTTVGFCIVKALMEKGNGADLITKFWEEALATNADPTLRLHGGKGLDVEQQKAKLLEHFPAENTTISVSYIND